MKGFAGGRLFDEKRSPFGVTLTPVQCIHYALTRPAVCSIMCGYDTKEQIDAATAYENASEEEKTMHPYLQMHHFTPTVENVLTAVTANLAYPIWILQ